MAIAVVPGAGILWLSSPYTAPLAQGVIMGAPIALQIPVAGVLTGGAIAALGYGAKY